MAIEVRQTLSNQVGNHANSACSDDNMMMMIIIMIITIITDHHNFRPEVAGEPYNLRLVIKGAQRHDGQAQLDLMMMILYSNIFCLWNTL